jgi:sulfoxide reductase heme-binding subunit YedZ
VVPSLVRARIGPRIWRGVHWLAYAAWPIALLHGIGSGSDAGTGWLLALVVGCVSAVAAAVGWRIAPRFAEVPPVVRRAELTT